MSNNINTILMEMDTYPIGQKIDRVIEMLKILRDDEVTPVRERNMSIAAILNYIKIHLQDHIDKMEVGPYKII
jgi:hypothetical protein